MCEAAWLPQPATQSRARMALQEPHPSAWVSMDTSAMTFSGREDSVSFRLSYSLPLGEGASGAVTVKARDRSSSELGSALHSHAPYGQSQPTLHLGFTCQDLGMLNPLSACCRLVTGPSVGA